MKFTQAQYIKDPLSDKIDVIKATIDGTEYATASVSFTYAAYQVRRGESTERDTRLE